MNLKELIEKYSQLEDDYLESEDATSEALELEKLLEASGADVNEKLNATCRLLLSLEGNIELIDKEVERLKKRKEYLNNTKTRIRAWIAYCLDGNKVDTGLFKISFRETTAVEVVDESLIPPQYLREKISYAPAKDEIKKDLVLGAEIPGVLLKKNIATIVK